MCFTAHDIHYTGIILSIRNVARPVVCLQNDHQNGENDDDTDDNDGDHRPGTCEAQGRRD